MEKIAKEEDELNTWKRRYTAVQMDLAAEVAKRRTHLSTVQVAEEPAGADPLLDTRGGPFTAAVAAVAMALLGGIAMVLLAKPRPPAAMP